MMLSSYFCAFIIAVGAIGLADRTAFAKYGAIARAPEPTAAPEFIPRLLKREYTSVCGYVNGNISAPYDCGNSICGFNTVNGGFGCCETAINGHPAGCDIITQCLDSTAFVASCGAACQSNTLMGWCTGVLKPYCNTIYLTAGRYTYSNFGCDSVIGETLHAVEYLTGGSGGDVSIQPTNSFTPTSSFSTPTGSTRSSSISTQQQIAASSFQEPTMGSISSVAFTQTQVTDGFHSEAMATATATPTSSGTAASRIARGGTGLSLAVVLAFGVLQNM